MAVKDTKKNIIKFLAGDEKVLLTSEEEKILARWEFAVEQLTQKKLKYSEIRDKVALKFVVSRFTAERDIVNAQEVFGINRKINKRFLLHAHIDRMDEVIETYKAHLNREEVYKGEKTKYIPDAKEMAALAKLSDAYTYAINSAPADSDITAMPPPIFVFKLPEGVTIDLPPMPKLLQAVDDYLQYEMLPDDTNTQPARSADQGKGDADPAPDA